MPGSHFVLGVSAGQSDASLSRADGALGSEQAMQHADSSNLTLLDGAVFDGPYEGLLRRRSAAEWLARHGHDPRVGGASRRARDGEEGACFRAVDGVVWHLRQVQPHE